MTTRIMPPSELLPVPVDSLKLGMELQTPLYDEGGNLLLAKHQVIDTPTLLHALQLTRSSTGVPDPVLVPVATLADAAAAVQPITLSQPVLDYIVRLIRATRESADLACGASPRAAVLLAGAARARAASAGRLHVSLDDVRAMALDVLRHRVLLNFAARAEGVTADTVVSALLTAG